MRYKSTNNLSATNAAYLAGLIDGEGTITLSRRHSNERRQLVVSISSTEPELVNWAAGVTGVGKVTHKRTVSHRHAPGLTYSVSNRQALSVLVQTVVYLRSYKRFRAAMAIERYLVLTPRNGKYTKALAAERLIFERAFLEITAAAVASNPASTY
jgi:hypothetical protein